MVTVANINFEILANLEKKTIYFKVQSSTSFAWSSPSANMYQPPETARILILSQHTLSKQLSSKPI